MRIRKKPREKTSLILGFALGFPYLCNHKNHFRKTMKPLNFNGKILLIPMAQLPRQTQDALRQEDGMQALGGANLFVYATGRVVSGCCCGHHHGGGHHHEDGHECCGGEHHREDGHECCGGGHHHETPYNADEADETYFASEDLAYGKEDPVTETIDDHLLLVVNEPVVIVNTSDAERIGFDAQQARWFELPPDGVTLVPGRDVDKGFFQTGPISIQLRD